jgi:hypothetical protein
MVIEDPVLTNEKEVPSPEAQEEVKHQACDCLNIQPPRLASWLYVVIAKWIRALHPDCPNRVIPTASFTHREVNCQAGPKRLRSNSGTASQHVFSDSQG